MRPWLFVLLLLTAPWAALAQRPELADPRFETVGDAVAITDSVVSTMVVDRTGFLWIGTAVGLVRFDGYEFTPFHPPSSDGYPPSTFVRTLMVTRDGLIWVGTDSDGLARFDPVANHWTLYRPGQGEGQMSKGTVRALVEGRDGSIWAGTVGGGLQRLDPNTGRFKRYSAADGLPDARVQSLMVARDGGLWVGTWNGVVHLAPEAQRFEAPLQAPELALRGRVVTLLHEDALGRIWVGTQGGELVRASLTGGSLQWLDGGKGLGGAVQSLVEMESSEVWLGRANGVEIRHAGDGQLQRLMRYSVTRPWGPAGTDIRAMVKDRSGVLWVGSYGGGLQRHVPNGASIWVRRGNGDEASVLGVADARSLVELRNGEIWVGTSERGVAVLDTELRLLHSFLPQKGYPGGRAGGITQALDGRVWAGSAGGVSVFDPEQRRWLQELPVGKGRVRMLRATDDGAVYAGTQDGLYRWRPGQAGFERLRRADGSELIGDVNALAQQRDGRVWVGGENGLYTLAPGAERMEPVLAAADAGLGSSTVLGLLVDRQQRLWVDTVVGLRLMQRWDGQQARFERISERIDLGGQSIGANLLEDAEGRIWTHRGAYDPVRGQFWSLSQADGVDIGTGWFRSYVGLRDGRLLFGGSRGVMVLDPRRFTPWHYAPPVVATELHINGASQPLARLQPQLQLGSDERNFSIKFASLDLSQPLRNRHRFRLDGLEQDWIEVRGDQRVAAFGALPPGSYTLQVQGSNRNGEWSPEALQLPIEVLPAWWQRWWAQLAALLLLIGLLLLGVQARTRVLSRRQAELEARVQQRTEELEALSETLREKSLLLEESALTDPLTGLHNRRFAVERLDDDLHLLLRRYEEAQRHGGRPPEDADLCFFLIDIDHFKQVNDQYGHAAGDAVLVQMRERLQEVFREADYLVRWGGEEFLVVARGSSRAGAPELAERARQAVARRPFLLSGEGMTGRVLTRHCSIGFACLPLMPGQPRATGWSTVLNLADAALYAAKREGRNRWVGVLDGNALSAEQLQQGLVGDGSELPEGLNLVRGP
jgi:diguanylate cyclase (GGDEF)-like protein